MINTMELAKQVTATGKRSGGREGRRALRAVPMASFPTLVRNIPTYQMVPDEAVELIHEESMKILEEVGCEFRDDEAISMWKAAGADVTGTRVRIDRALLMSLVEQVPPEFTLNARNPERTVKVGGKNTVFVPMYGAPYVRGLDGERRYGSLADLNNLHKLAYMSPALAFLKLDHLRAHGNSGSQAAPAYHSFGAETFRQAVHGHRHVEGAGRGRDEDVGHRVWR